MENILVAIDLEENSKLLIEHAAQQAEKFGSKVWVLHIADPEPDFIGNKVGPQYIRDLRLEELLKEHHFVRQYADDLNAKGIAADGLLIAGATTNMILKEIEKLNIDLVVIGHHQHSLLYKLFNGNTATSIIEKARIPVLIIPL
jgi:nucleotide-binding universal stress UspA family protein